MGFSISSLQLNLKCETNSCETNSFLQENNYQDGKMITIYDCRHIRIGHVKDYTPMAIKQLVEAKQHAIPMRLMAVHHLYAPTVLEWVLSTFRFVDKILKTCK